MAEYDVSGFVDPNEVVKFSTTSVFVGIEDDVEIFQNIADIFESGDVIGSDSISQLTPEAFYPTIPNQPILTPVGITDPYWGWIETTLPGGLGTAPTILRSGVQPVQNVSIAAGAEPIPEPTSLIIWSLLATLGFSVYWRRRRRTA